MVRTNSQWVVDIAAFEFQVLTLRGRAIIENQVVHAAFASEVHEVVRRWAERAEMMSAADARPSAPGSSSVGLGALISSPNESGRVVTKG